VSNKDGEVCASKNETQALLLKVDSMIRDCEQAILEAKADRDSSALVKLMRELRASVALKHHLLQQQERANGTGIGFGETSEPGRKELSSESVYERVEILSHSKPKLCPEP